MGLDSAVYFLFLGCVVVIHAFLSPRSRVVLLLIASLAFYASFSVGYLVLFLALCGLNYIAVLQLSRDGEEGRRKRALFLAIALNFIMLVTFKYATDAINSAIAHLGWAQSGTSGAFRIITPLGISYFCFQMIAANVDAYAQRWKPEGGLPRFALFGLFFPQITSGPIPRAGRLVPQLAGVTPTSEDRAIGLRLLAFGLFKKYVIANRLNDYVNLVFDSQSALSGQQVLVGCCFNALQLYADFSACIDIAIGSARLLGIRLDPNFDRPYLSSSITELWRRWHMTLSFWLRDYVFTPLAWLFMLSPMPKEKSGVRGLVLAPLLSWIRRNGKLGLVIALMISFVAIGVWHAATWPFLIFGVTQGVAVSIELLTSSWRMRRLAKMPQPWVKLAGQIYAATYFVLCLVLFRCHELARARQIYAVLLQFSLAHMIPIMLMVLVALAGVGLLLAAARPRLANAPLAPIFVFCMLLAIAGKFLLMPMPMLTLLTIVVWLVVAAGLSFRSERAVPLFVCACGLLVLFLGRVGTAPFVYAGF